MSGVSFVISLVSHLAISVCAETPSKAPRRSTTPGSLIDDLGDLTTVNTTIGLWNTDLI